jgi:serine/threonine kinase PknH
MMFVNIIEPISRTAEPPIPAPVPSPTYVDPEAASYAQLRAIADSDRPFVSAQLADHWVPQLSSKRPGIVDKGIVWDNVATLNEHLLLRETFPGVRLLWSGDWSTFDASNFWVTVAGVTFATADGALAWCTNQALGPNDCYAKLVSATHPVAGSTAHN